MNLITFKYREDFGHEWYVQILNTDRHLPRPFKERSLIQLSLGWNDEPSWPYLQISSGYGRVFDMLICLHKFSFSFDIFSRTWNFARLESLDETED